MGLLRNLLVGRPNGLRRRLFGRRAPDAPPAPRAPAPAPPASSPAGPAYEPAEKALKLKKEPPRDVTPPEGFEVVLHRDALEKGRIIEIIVGGTAIAVANVEGTFHAVSNQCPHADGPLGEGTLDGSVVTCPYHGWQYDVRDGRCLTNPHAPVKTFPVQVVGDAVCVKL